MKRIVLACSAGMSTSLVVIKMEKEAQARGLELKIYAIPEQNLRDELQSYAGDIIAVLLGRRCASNWRKIKSSPMPIRSRWR
ncbi:Oligo-beta-mannoside-specific phosphotransferase enzyme IIB component [Serratia rubidaea]|uniref:Oligo-beta-mannoside-specific phosphotransferase enzyme IIB component n=1 Tax=Serratia rubidaea TaxID=61652 RepID=A0A447QIF8_SERRU|nr:Oligo-beta-mannoside-specific phosphotransferase enzyme IIB component [Serratia rubidaea]